MEDDDDFGDLYTDVIQSFPSTSQPSSSSSFVEPQRKAFDLSQSARGSIDLNLQIEEEDGDEENGDSGVGTSNSGVAQTLARMVNVGRAGLELNFSGGVGNSGQKLRSGDAMELRIGNGSENRESGKADGGSVGGAGGNFDEDSFRFDLEEEAQDGSELVIPGLSTGPGAGDIFDDFGREEAGGDDWDSDDSEDDLQIVLNDTSHGPMGMEMGGPMGGELDDGQNEGLGIGLDGDGVGFQHPGIEQREWGEDGAQAADGEKKEGGDAAKLNAGIAMGPKPGYVGHGYQPFHSQFKYVRPGAAPLHGAPAAGPVGAHNQARPLLNVIPLAGRGRGDWRPPGTKNVPGMQKGYGGLGWGNNAGGRGFGIGLDFTLPSHKTIFEVDIDGFEEKPWNNPGVDVTDFFNFSLSEDSYKGYCKQLEQFRVESTMQSRIRVYESGRSEQEYDPDMPPELAAATGVNENAAEHVKFRKTDAIHTDVGKSSVPSRPPIPTGRPIQVETGSGERLPTINTRPPRIRDSDAIIEIVCEGFAEGQSSEDGSPQPSEHDVPSKTNNTKNPESEEVHVESKHAVVLSSEETRLPSTVKARQHSEPSGSRGHTPVHSTGSEDRRLEDDSPQSRSRQDNLQHDQRDESTERVDDKTNASVSPDKVKDDGELSADHIAKDDNDLPLAIDSVGLEDNIQRDKSPPAKNQDEVLPHSKRQKVGSCVSLPSEQVNGEDLKATRSGDNSKSRPGNSKEYQKSHDVGEEVIQGGHVTSMRNSKRHSAGDEGNVERRNHDDRRDMERSRDLVKGREDPYTHRDGGLARPSYLKNESSDKRKERDSSERVRQRRDEDSHSRRVSTNDYRKLEPRVLDRGDEMGSKYSGKPWDGDRIEKDEHLYSRKHADNGRGHHDKDVALRQRERDERLKSRHENVDDYRRRKNEGNLRRDYSEKEEMLLSHRESPSLQKREREDILDQRRRDDQTRTREGTKDYHSMRQKDELRMEKEKSERHGVRDDQHRTKQYREGSMTKREREEVREPARSGRGIEDKWANHAKEKDESNDAARYAEANKSDRVDDVHFLHHKGHADKYARAHQSSNHDSKSSKDRPSRHTDPYVSSNHKINDVNQKESSRNKEYDTRSQNSLNISKKAKDDHSSHKSEKAGTKHSSGQGNIQQHTQPHPKSTRKQREEVPADYDEHPPSKKGRSKLERWSSHKEMDCPATTKSASSLKAKDTIESSISTESSVPVESRADKPAKSAEAIDPKPSLVEKTPQGMDSMKESENKNSDVTADQHLDTVAKLKKRSERFKLPMPSEKETRNKNSDSDVQLLSQTEPLPAEPEVKSERPPRKRRWISS